MTAGEQKKAVEAAKNLLLKGINPEIITECIGLSLEEVQNWRKKLPKLLRDDRN